MSFVDSLDSVMMLYAYASPSRSTPEGKIGLFQSTKIELDEEADRLALRPSSTLISDSGGDGNLIGREVISDDPTEDGKARIMDNMPILPVLEEIEPSSSGSGPDIQAIDKKKHVISSLSVTLTALSIIVALR
jgi:high-affinity nickel-transport protein